MKNKISKVCLLFLLTFNIAKAKEIELIDENNLITSKTIIYNSDEELNGKLEEVLKTLHNKGYIFSDFEFSNGKFLVTSRKIRSVKYDDGTNSLIKLKKYINNLNIEGEIFNINKINNIIEEFNKNKNNKVVLNISISEDKKFVDLEFKNKIKKYKSLGLNTVSSLLDKNNSFIYNIDVNFEQNLGLNERVNINASILNKLKKIDASIGTKIRGFDISLSNSFKEVDTIDKEEKIINIVNKTEVKLIKDKLENKLSCTIDRQSLRDIKLKQLSFLEYDVAINEKNKNIYVRPSLKVAMGFDNLKYEKTILQPRLNINYELKNYEADIEIGGVLLNSKDDGIFGRYLLDNDLSYSTAPVGITKNRFSVILNNKLKTVGAYKDLIYMPFMELAIGYGDKKVNLGSAIGVQMKYKDLNLGMKYSVDLRKNQNLSIILNYNLHN